MTEQDEVVEVQQEHAPQSPSFRGFLRVETPTEALVSPLPPISAEEEERIAKQFQEIRELDAKNRKDSRDPAAKKLELARMDSGLEKARAALPVFRQKIAEATNLQGGLQKLFKTWQSSKNKFAQESIRTIESGLAEVGQQISRLERQERETKRQIKELTANRKAFLAHRPTPQFASNEELIRDYDEQQQLKSELDRLGCRVSSKSDGGFFKFF